MEIADFEKNIKHLNCPLCKTIIRVPRSLPCKHDICQACLKDHIVRTVPMSGYDIYEYVGKKDPDIKPVQQEFVCPVPECDTKIRPRNPSKSTYEWAAQFDNNTRLLSVLKMCLGEFPASVLSCDTCRLLSWTTPVKSVCFTCSQKMCLKCEYVHKELNQSHTICDIPTSYKPKTLSSLLFGQENEATKLQFTPLNGSVRVCKFHHPLRMTMACVSCRAVGCEKCFESSHTKCQLKSKLSEISQTVNAQEIMQNTKIKLELCRERCLNTSAEFVVMLQEISQRRAASDSSEQSTDELIQTLSCFVSRFEYLRDNIQRCQAKLLESEKQETIDSAATFTIIFCEEQCDQIETQITDSGREAAAMKKKVDAHVKILVRDSEQQQKEKDRMRLAFEAMVYDKDATNVADESERVHLQKSMLMKTYTDAKDCWLTDCQFLDENCIVVTDYGNRKLKVADIVGILQEVQYESGPWGVAVNKDHMICVSLPDQQYVQVLEAKTTAEGYALQEVKKHTFQSKCYGVTFLDVNIAVTLQKKIVIVNEKGEILREIPLNLITSEYIKSVGNEDSFRIMLSDFRRNMVAMFDLRKCDVESDVTIDLQTEMQAGYATGIDISADGQSFYCNNRAGTVCSVKQSKEDEEMTVVLDTKRREANVLVKQRESRETILIKGLSMPRSVTYIGSSGRLAVTVDSGSQKNFVHIYEIQ